MTRSSDIRRHILSDLLHSGRITRRQLVATGGYRAATVQKAVNELKEAGIVAEPERAGIRTGRRSPELRLDPGLGVFAGIELRPDKVLGCLIDTGGRIMSSRTMAYTKGLTADTSMRVIGILFHHLKAAGKAAGTPCLGIGFADPGLVNMAEQRSIRAVSVPGWKNIDTAAWLRKVSGLSDILVIPESGARTFAEYHARADDHPGSLFHLALNAFIGGGFVREGLLFEGDAGMAMEIGHLTLDPEGSPCQCGNRGCLEAMAGENGIRCRVAELQARGVRTALAAETFTLSALVEAVKRQDRVALRLAADASSSIALALASVVTLLNPSLIVISGELTGLGDVLLGAVRRTLSMHCFPEVVARLSVRFSTLDDYAGGFGAALLARNHSLMRLI